LEKQAQFKNLAMAQTLDFADLVTYQPGTVVSRTLAQNKAANVTLFAFAAQEEISSHSSSGDALVIALDGEAKVTIGGAEHTLKTGESIVMPADIPHAVLAITSFKMLLVVMFAID
jgi:quercetin dioxygenase-like cupin family protein